MVIDKHWRLSADPYTVRNSTFFTLHDYEKNQPLSSSGSGSDGRQTATMNETVEIGTAVKTPLTNTSILSPFLFFFFQFGS